MYHDKLVHPSSGKRSPGTDRARAHQPEARKLPEGNHPRRNQSRDVKLRGQLEVRICLSGFESAYLVKDTDASQRAKAEGSESFVEEEERGEMER